MTYLYENTNKHTRKHTKIVHNEEQTPIRITKKQKAEHMEH